MTNNNNNEDTPPPYKKLKTIPKEPVKAERWFDIIKNTPANELISCISSNIKEYDLETKKIPPFYSIQTKEYKPFIKDSEMSKICHKIVMKNNALFSALEKDKASVFRNTLLLNLKTETGMAFDIVNRCNDHFYLYPKLENSNSDLSKKCKLFYTEKANELVDFLIQDINEYVEKNNKIPAYFLTTRSTKYDPFDDYEKICITDYPEFYITIVFLILEKCRRELEAIFLKTTGYILKIRHDTDLDYYLHVKEKKTTVKSE